MKFLALFLATAVAALLAGTAGAADPMPTFSGCGVQKKDGATDGSSTGANGPIPEAEIEGAWVNAGVPDVNLVIANLTGEVPAGATSLTYNAEWSGTTDQGLGVNFVRAHIDFAGMVSYEYGHTEDLQGQSTRYAYDGPTEGKLFPGEHGVVQIKIPPEAGGKPGTTLKGASGKTQVGRTTVVPGAVNQSPSRGLSFPHDDVGLGNIAIGPCAAGATKPTNTTTTGPTTTQPSQQSAALPVTLAKKSIKKAKKGKTVKIALRSSEPLTKVAVRIAKGASVLGTGKLAKLAGKGTVKIKLKKALKKGTYSFDVAGTDSKGGRRVGSLKLKVK